MTGMKAVEFEAQVGPGHTVALPPDAAAAVAAGQAVRVILLIPDHDDEAADWSHLGLQQFASGYDEEDAIYDDIPGVQAR
jgi:hypothetical protein